MATILANGLVQFEDGHILYSDTVINGADFMELQELLPRINPVIGRSAMVGFPFISGGGGGAGTPGAPGQPGAQGVTGVAGGGTGLQGETGPQGVTGPSGGPPGATGVQGTQGTTGIQGETGAGVQGQTGVQGTQGQTGVQGQTGPAGTLLHDIFAADRVVDPTGNGTDLTLTTALTALASTGGTIYLKEQMIAPSTPFVLPLQNITIIGAGGNTNGPLVDPSATIFNLGANAIPLFQTAAGGGGTTFASYKFVGFKVVGTSVLGQAFIQAPAPALGSSVICEDLQIDSVQMIVQTNGQDITVMFTDCTLNPTTASASFWNAPTPGGELCWNNVQAQLPASGSAIAIAGGPEWDVAYSYLGGPSTFSTIVVEDINWVAFELGKNGDKLQITVNAAISTIVSCQFIGISLIIDTTLFFFSNSWMSGSSNGTSPQLTLNGVGGIGDMNIHGVNFDASGAAATTGITVNGITNIAITGCQFESHSTAGILVSGTTTLTVTGNRFSEAVPVSELAATVTGRYTGNDGFTGSVILGPNSVVEESRRFDMTGGTTTNAFVTLFTHQNAKGLLGIGTIVNTGANSLTVQVTVTDAFGTTVSVSLPTVTPGNSLMLDEQVNLSTAFPPYISYAIAVESTTPGSPTTFNIHHASHGAY